MIFAVIISCFV